jgi:hypothetical protein
LSDGVPSAPSRVGGVADLAAIEDITLLDSYGQERRLGEFWADRPAVVVWLRHYG